MRRGVDIAVGKVVDGIHRAAHWLEPVRARLGREALAAIGVGLIVVLGGAGYLAWQSDEAPQVPVQKELRATGRYSVTCSACGQREFMNTPPLATLAQRDGLLQCPKCQAFKADWNRRGSLSISVSGP